jgi:hypothetical protein
MQLIVIFGDYEYLCNKIFVEQTAVVETVWLRLFVCVCGPKNFERKRESNV